MENKEIPNYYAILPANVRYDKRLKLLSRLMYAEITSLCNKEGYCWASNSYFANLYGVSNRTITDCISQLKKYNYINIFYIQNNTNTDKRKIYINCIQNIDGIEENFQGYRRKLPDGIEENFQGYRRKLPDGIEENFQGYRRKLPDGIEENFQQNNKKNNKKNNKSDCLETIDIIQNDSLSNESLTSLSLKKNNKITKSNSIKAKDDIENLNFPFGDCEYDLDTNRYKNLNLQKENNIKLIKNAIATNNIDVLDDKTFKSIDDINMFNFEFENNKRMYPIYLNKMLGVHSYDYKTTFKIVEHFIQYDFIDISFNTFCNIIVVLINDLINTNFSNIFELCKGKDKVKIIENLFNQLLIKKIDVINFIFEYKSFIQNNFLEWYNKQSLHTKKASVIKQLINKMECFINE